MKLFNFLNHQSVREAKISDHEPVIFGEFLTWNIMMQGSYNSEKKRYNNGMLLSQESQAEYQKRLTHIVRTLAEICHLNPEINIIALEEAPIKAEDIDVFIAEFKKIKTLEKFKALISEDCFSKMGIVTFINSEQYAADFITRDIKQLPAASLKDRIQEFRLIHKSSGERHHITNVHMPFDLAKSRDGMLVLCCFAMQLLNFTQNKQGVHSVLGDFNFDPTFLLQAYHQLSIRQLQSCIPRDNNTLVEVKGDKVSYLSDTVDAIFTTRAIEFRQPIRDARELSFFFTPVKEKIEETSAIHPHNHSFALALRA